jgi:arylsulfatase A-like enzyme
MKNSTRNSLQNFFIFFLALTIFLGLTNLISAKEKSSSKRPNIIFLESDDHNFQSLGCMGEPVKTPNIDRLAARGVLFRNNICQGTACAPSRNSLLTGSYPHNTGVYYNPDGNMDAGVWTFPLALQRSGYSTALIGKNHFRPNSEYVGEIAYKPYDLQIRDLNTLGFEYIHAIGGKVISATGTATPPHSNAYRDYLREKGVLEKLENDYEKNRKEIPAISSSPSALSEEDCEDSYIARQVIQFLQNYSGDKPFFIWTDFVSPHPPADAPEPYASMYDVKKMRMPISDPLEKAPPRVKALAEGLKKIKPEDYQKFRTGYYAMITALDTQIGHILDALEKKGELDNTVIIFAGDQGSLLGDHGLWGKGSYYKGSANSPLIIAGVPSIQKGKTIDSPVELLDVAKTILEVAGAPDPDLKKCRGYSLMPFLTGNGSFQGKEAFAEEADWQLIQDSQYKYVRYPEQNILFDLKNDPNELHNLAGTLPAVEEKMTHQIDEWLSNTAPVKKPNFKPVAPGAEKGHPAAE